MINFSFVQEYGCADTLYVFAFGSGSHQLIHSASGNTFPLIMVDDQHLEVEFISCVRNTPQASAGFKAHVSFEGNILMLGSEAPHFMIRKQNYQLTL